ncbi:ABC transporter ATP-binding protein/permease [Synechococcus sp. CS-1327]|nr:ABC transporter ATP-binding protein/permease [Synechococcus sp. CS-1326]MCT0234524.1 ABC transporter ATP-binding protein/permease [Synechococcus sp. CS-1327]
MTLPRLLRQLSSPLKRAVRTLGGSVLAPLIGAQPAPALIRSTARQQWRLIALNFGTSLVEAFTEGATLAVIFLAVDLLSRPVSAAGGSAMNWASNPLIGRFPGLVEMLTGVPRTPVFLILMSLAVLLQATQSLTRFLNGVSVVYFGARCNALITARIHSQILKLSYPCSSSYRVGDLTNYAAEGPQAVTKQIEQTSQLLLQVLLTAVYLTVLISLSPWLLLLAVGLALTITFLQQQLLPRIGRQAQRVTQSQVAISTRITEDFQGLRLLHSSGQLDAADQALRSQMGNLEQGLRRQGLLMNIVAPLSSFLPILAMAVIAALSLVVFGARSTGVLPSLVTFVLALQRLNVRLAGIAGSFNAIAENTGRFERLNEILSPAGKQYRRERGIRFEALRTSIDLEGVGLRYAADLPPALEQINLSLARGSTTALVGASGAGKSSIADLMVGLYAPTAGRIRIDGTDLADLELSSWQQRLGVVSQDTFLFNASLAENIAYGCPWAGPIEIEAAAEAAQAMGFIELLPDGMATLVGERGYRLSGGQRQRISLARAILRKPELLILDEATSALDSQSEQLVQEAIERFEREHTVLVIAHRLSTIVNADLIGVLDHGRIVERGRHRELLERAGPYAKLWEQQAGPGVAQQSALLNQP